MPQINIGLVATKNKGLPVLFRTYDGNITDVRKVEQLIADVKRVDLSIDVIIQDRGMTSRNNLIKLAGDNLKIIGGIPLTSNGAKELVMHDISEENEIMHPSGLIYYEDLATSLFGIPGRAIICFNHSDLERERTARLKKIGIAEIKVAEILSSQTGNVNPEGLEKEIRAAIRGVSDYFVINNDGKIVTVAPHAENRRNARLRDGKCLLFTTNFERSAPEIIATYFGKDVIEKIFDCFKNWLDLQPIRHFEKGNIDVYIFVCYLAYLALALYKHHLGVAGWEGVKDSLDELGRIRKTTLDFGGERQDKISVLTKEQKEIIEKLGFADALFEL